MRVKRVHEGNTGIRVTPVFKSWYNNLMITSSSFRPFNIYQICVQPLLLLNISVSTGVIGDRDLLFDRNEDLIENWNEGPPCYISTKNLAALCNVKSQRMDKFIWQRNSQNNKTFRL